MLVKVIWKTSKDKTIVAALVGEHTVCRITLQEIHDQKYWVMKLLLPDLLYRGGSCPYHTYEHLPQLKEWAEEQIVKWFKEAIGG